MTLDDTPPPRDDEPGRAAPVDTAMPRARSRVRTAVIVAGALAITAGIWLVVAMLPDLLTRDPDAPTEPAAAQPAVPARLIHATLFHVSEDGGALVASGQDVPYGATPTEQARHIIEAQVKPATGRLASAIPRETVVRAVYLTPNGTAYVDFGPEIVTHHSGGSLNEALTVYTIVNALTVNLPDITSVQILVDGRDVDTLAGHLDLRRPIGRTTAWVKKGS
jgi:hypothetical protein